MSDTEQLRQEINQFLVDGDHLEGGTNGGSTTEKLLTLIESEKRKAVEEAVPLAINANVRHLFNSEAKLAHLVAEVQNIMFGSGSYTSPSSTFQNDNATN